MLSFVFRRLTFIIVVAIAIVFFVFLGMRMTRNSTAPRGDFRIASYAQTAVEDTERFLANAVQGDFGTVQLSRDRTVPVSQVLLDTYFKSMGLLITSLILSLTIGLIVGTIASLRQSSTASFVLLSATVIGISIPSFFVAMLLQVLTIKLVQRYGVRIAFAGGFGWDWRHMIFPVIVLSARPVAYITRVTFVTLGGIFFEDYIRTANAKGLSRRQVVTTHALRNAAVPILTAGAISLRFALGALPVVEFFFGWPGLGDRMLTGIRNGEVEVVATLALALGTTFLIVNLVLDVLYRFIDPRIRDTVA
ncbi:MAG: ABC transporter permease [Anaerolineae bacterium]|nr:ABC transporter permease [Anaerolineae bacterium]MCB0230682.1 ABC transporter permease [Anaerolineae bacterium]MCB0236916.1 ABC transporter permease [Anaerolineae bacterium]MCB0249517.1 ABC transporter permease [Anaerolineae bacterium]MCO5244406.1 ABC transporter permease [Anaerolineae bacterium]